MNEAEKLAHKRRLAAKRSSRLRDRLRSEGQRGITYWATPAEHKRLKLLMAELREERAR